MENPGAQAVLTSHCPNSGEKSKVFPPKLLFLPPCCFGCMHSGGPLFQFNRGQRAERKSLLSHPESSHTLTDNVTHNVREIEAVAVTGRTIVGEQFT